MPFCRLYNWFHWKGPPLLAFCTLQNDLSLPNTHCYISDWFKAYTVLKWPQLCICIPLIIAAVLVPLSLNSFPQHWPSQTHPCSHYSSPAPPYLLPRRGLQWVLASPLPSGIPPLPWLWSVTMTIRAATSPVMNTHHSPLLITQYCLYHCSPGGLHCR